MANPRSFYSTILHLGSNVGDRESNLSLAIEQIQNLGSISQTSSLFKTAPWGKLDQAYFINQALELKTSIEAIPLLDKLLEIEKTMGRIREEKWGPRLIDIDIIFFDDQIMETEKLHIPHPGMHLRNFVLEPVTEIAADWVHPVFKKSVETLLKESPDEAVVEKI